MNRETLRVRLTATTAAALNNPIIKCAVWLPRTAPMTFGIVVLLCVIHGFTGLEGDIKGLRATWGHDPEKPLSWLTHAFLHANKGHLTPIILAFAPSGGLIELYLGRTQLAVIILFTAIAAAVMSGISVPEYWDTNSNPVGFSAVADATFVLGVYMGGRVTTVWVATTLTARPMLKKLRDWPWATLGTTVGITTAGLWLTWEIGGEWANQDAAPRVAHSFGMLTGGIAAILIATSTETERNRPLGRPIIGFAITVTLLAILAITIPAK